MVQGVVLGGDYIDEDVAYLLGMLFGNGQLIEDGSLRRIIITLTPNTVIRILAQALDEKPGAGAR